jgi:hypothetical protein
LDLFQVASAAPHEFAWLTHVGGEPAGGSLRATNATKWPTGAPWSYLRQPRSATANGQVWESFSDGGRTLRLDLLADGPAEVVHCGFPRDDGPAAATVPMRLFKRQGTNAWFLAAYRFVDKPGEPVELKSTASGPDNTDIAVRAGERTSVHTVPRLQ